MNKSKSALIAALVALSAFAGLTARADNMASIAITPATGAVTLTPRWSIGSDLAGFHHMSQDLGLTGSVANNFYSIINSTIPSGGNTLAFNYYVAASGSATPHSDIGSKLTPDSYSALTSADPDVGYGSVNLYFIHHKGTTDYFTVIKPGSASSSEVTDLKPMSGPGGPGTVTGVSGYFGLTFAAANLGYGLNNFYYLRTDPATNNTKFGTLDPALLSSSADQFDLGSGGHKALAFTGADVGYGTDKMYYLRLDPVTGFTILGMLDPALAGTRHTSDIANLGSVFSTLTFKTTDLGFGSNRFYTTGSVNTTWQSVSFAAIADRAIATGSFNVNPTASSALPIVLTVVPGSVGAASITDAGGGVFTVTPTSPGLITLQATQAGQAAPAAPVYEYNMLRQSFTITGVATLEITTQPTSQSVVTGNTATFTVAASGTSSVSYQWRKAGANITGNASATTATLSLTNAQSADQASYDVAVTNASGTIYSNSVTLTVTTAAPIITNSPLTAGGTAGTAFAGFTITASGSPTSFSASPLPAGLVINTTTGAITGTPTTAATTSVLLGATNSTGTGNATLTITVAAAGVAPVINNSPLTAGGTAGTAFAGFTITASGSPTSFSASPLPAGLAINTTTGAITGTPTAAGTTSVTLGATNSTGTGNATLTITVAAAGVAPVINNSPLTASGTVGTVFGFTITATGSPTSYSASPLPAGLAINTTTGAITGTPTAAGTTSVTLGATNGTGTGTATLSITIAAAPVVAPVINSTLTASGTVGTAFSYTITGTNSPTSYSATTLPAGLTRSGATLSGTPTATGSTSVTIGAINGTGTGTATLTITIAAAPVVAPVINSTLTASGTVGAAFSYTITATNSPTSFSATPLPAGLTRTGAFISGTPSAAGVTSVTLGATNVTGTANVTLTITIAAAQVVVPPAILAVLPQITTPVTDWRNYQPTQILVQPAPGVNATFNMVYHQEGVYTVGVGTSVIPGESLITIASTAGIDLIVSLLENGIVEYDIRIRGAVVTTTLKSAVGLCATEYLAANKLPGSSATTVAGTIVSVAFFYDESTAAAADQLSIDGYGIAVVENGNLALSNSGVTNLRWRFAGTSKVTGFTSDGNTLTDLTAMANVSSTLGAVVLQVGNELIADQALFMFNVFQTDGASGRAESPGHNSTVYWQAPWYVFVHQLGHNFGAHHDRVFDNVADGNGQFNYGFSWLNPLDVTTDGVTTTTQVGYGTMLSVWGLDYIQPAFSNNTVSLIYVGNYGTNQQFTDTRAIGVAIDQPKAADNAKTLSEAGLSMAGFRLVVGNPTPPTNPVTPAVTPPAPPRAPSSSGGGDLSLWFYVAIAALAGLRRKFGQP